MSTHRNVIIYQNESKYIYELTYNLHFVGLKIFQSIYADFRLELNTIFRLRHVGTNKEFTRFNFF